MYAARIEHTYQQATVEQVEDHGEDAEHLNDLLQRTKTVVG